MADFLKSLKIKGIEIDPAGAATDQILKYDGTKFIPGTASGGGSSVTVSDNPPSSPVQGNIWFESDTGRVFIYYDSFWIEVGASASSTPVGTVTSFAGSTAPSGWLLCSGQTVSRTTYAGLFAVLNTTYGSGDGSTTFNIPDLRGRTIAGLDNMGGTAAGRLSAATIGGGGDNLGEVGGSQTHALVTAEMPSHTHTQNAHTHDLGPGQSFGMSGTNFGGGNAGAFAVFGAAVQVINQGTYTGPYSATSNTATNQNTGGGGAHNNMQPTILMNYIIKA
jgi:microcystin-dependent protein